MGCYVHINDGRHTALVVHESKELILSRMEKIRNDAYEDKKAFELRMAASQITLTGFESGQPVSIINPWSFISYLEEQDDNILLERMKEWKAAQEAKKAAMERQIGNPRLSIPRGKSN